MRADMSRETARAMGRFVPAGRRGAREGNCGLGQFARATDGEEAEGGERAGKEVAVMLPLVRSVGKGRVG